MNLRRTISAPPEVCGQAYRAPGRIGTGADGCFRFRRSRWRGVSCVDGESLTGRTASACRGVAFHHFAQPSIFFL